MLGCTESCVQGDLGSNSGDQDVGQSQGVGLLMVQRCELAQRATGVVHQHTVAQHCIVFPELGEAPGHAVSFWAIADYCAIQVTDLHCNIT